jgi:hypothetical protein
LKGTGTRSGNSTLTERTKKVVGRIVLLCNKKGAPFVAKSQLREAENTSYEYDYQGGGTLPLSVRLQASEIRCSIELSTRARDYELATKTVQI